ncbi:hypothetical protein HFO72_33545 [Rhizobium laguerreae]|uniref:hypothetical protein n=1 Tax=Rhizobium laguerreae TaxID=1076926 RepID=UPI001C9068CE|nr:hypothetical protein [Rhizobium laguerreae]MBY3095656.1 hypothetical protein [Rhizobium laguerreae]
MNTPLTGRWIYRSFHNVPKQINSFEEVGWAQAELTLTASGDSLIGTLDGGSWQLAMRGAAQFTGDLWTFQLRAEGIDGTVTAGWIYEYSGVLNEDWPHAEDHRPTLVGTVIRTAFHPTERVAGQVGSFIAVSIDTPADTYTLPQSLIDNSADRVHRLHHAVWHGLRNSWDIIPDDRKQQIRHLNWEPPRVARDLSKGSLKRPYVSNGSGEDFLFMHRQMVDHYRMLVRQAGQTPVEWITLPEPGASDHLVTGDIVPPAWETPEAPNFSRRLQSLKSDQFYWTRLRWWDQQYKDPSYLRTLTLGEFGALMEFSVHNDMHMRWSEQPRDPETRAPSSFGRPSADFRKRWDNSKYNWLGEFYSAHLNPFFWRLHGWIDDRIEDWFTAHEEAHPGTVVRRQLGGVNWFEPGPWVQIETPWVWPESLGSVQHGHGMAKDEVGGGDPSGHDHGHGHHEGQSGGHDNLYQRRLESMEALVVLLFGPGPMEADTAKETSDMVTKGLTKPAPIVTSVIGLD